MADEKTALTDPETLEWKSVRNGDAYQKGMTVADAYRYLNATPRKPIQPDQVGSQVDG
jgi:hypothetical protein